MHKDELQYLADTATIELLASDLAPASQSKICDLEMSKQAGLFNDLGLDSVASSIKSFVKDNVGSAKDLLNFLSPAILYRVHPLIGGAAAIARELGFNLTSIFSKIKNSLTEPLSKGEGVTLNEVDSVVKDAVGLSATGASLEPARNLLVKTARPRWRGISRKRDIPFGYTKGKPLLFRIFGNLGKLRGRTLAAGILVWFIKTFLLSAGLVLGASALTSVFQSDEEEATENESPGAGYDQKPKPTKYTVKKQDLFEHSGRGTQNFANNSNNLWIVPLINRSINNTLLAWTIDVYPELSKYEDAILDSSKFHRTVQMLKRNYNHKRPDALIMPREFHSRKEVVDSFIDDVAQQIGK